MGFDPIVTIFPIDLIWFVLEKIGNMHRVKEGKIFNPMPSETIHSVSIYLEVGRRSRIVKFHEIAEFHRKEER